MLKTEQRNEYTTHIDIMTALEMAEVMQAENINAAMAVGKVLPEIARVIDRANEGLRKGGRIFYIGCGTSGRLGVLDASECPPTYGVSKDMVVGIIAGGDYALRNAIEGVEDDAEAGRNDLAQFEIGPADTVVVFRWPAMPRTWWVLCGLPKSAALLRRGSPAMKIA